MLKVQQTISNLADHSFLKNPAAMLVDMRATGALVKVKLPIVGYIWVTATHAATSQVVKGKDKFYITGEAAGIKKTGQRGLTLVDAAHHSGNFK